MKANPYISFVVAGGNGDYDGRFPDRLNSFTDIIRDQCQQFKLECEIVVVDWNPPHDRPPLHETLKTGLVNEHPAVRTVLVPSAIHQKLPGADNCQFLEFLAKNTGVRRAQGKFILVTNPDIVFCDELIERLARCDLNQDTFYRVDRIEITGRPPTDGDRESVLAYCEQQAIRLAAPGYTVDMDPNLPFPLRLSKARHTARRNREKNVPLRVEDRIHTNASGDFMLMHRDAWARLRGFPERADSGHVDSYLVSNAYASGYLQEHWESYHYIFRREPEQPQASGQAEDEYRRWAADAERMINDRRPLMENDLDWGLGTHDLEINLVIPSLNNEIATGANQDG